MGPTALLPLRRKACWGFFRPKNPMASAGFEPANLGTKGQHATPRPPKDTCNKIIIWFTFQTRWRNGLTLSQLPSMVIGDYYRNLSCRTRLSQMWMTLQYQNLFWEASTKCNRKNITVRSRLYGRQAGKEHRRLLLCLNWKLQVSTQARRTVVSNGLVLCSTCSARVFQVCKKCMLHVLMIRSLPSAKFPYRRFMKNQSPRITTSAFKRRSEKTERGTS